MPTRLSEEVTSIHPIKLLAQARQLCEIGAVPALLSKMGPLLDWEREGLVLEVQMSREEVFFFFFLVARLRRTQISICRERVGEKKIWLLRLRLLRLNSGEEIQCAEKDGGATATENLAAPSLRLNVVRFNAMHSLRCVPISTWEADIFFLALTSSDDALSISPPLCDRTPEPNVN